MPAYGQYCPVARALEVVGDRWSLLIVRERLAGRHHLSRWAFDDPRPEELDPAWLLSSMLKRRRAGAVARRVVIEFRFRGCRRSHVWLLLAAHGESGVCLKHPGFEPDLVVSAEARAFFEVWLGRMSRSEAERRGLLRIEGASELRRAFPGWFDWPSRPAPRATAGAPRLGSVDGP